jgi:phosphatidylglycerol lysyltransferase
MSINQNRLLTGDLVRCRKKIENGMLEFLTVSMMEWASNQGCETFSLSAVTAVGKETEQEGSLIAKVIKAFSAPINRLFKFKGTYLYKEKFHPHWEPHYICYPGIVTLAPALLTLVRLYSYKKPVRMFNKARDHPDRDYIVQQSLKLIELLGNPIRGKH